MEKQNISQSQSIISEKAIGELEKKYHKSITVHIAEFRDDTLHTIGKWSDMIFATIEKAAVIAGTLSYIFQKNIFFGIALCVFFLCVIIKHILPDSPLTNFLRNPAESLRSGEKKK